MSYVVRVFGISVQEQVSVYSVQGSPAIRRGRLCHILQCLSLHMAFRLWLLVTGASKDSVYGGHCKLINRLIRCGSAKY